MIEIVVFIITMLLNFVGFVIVGILFQQITKVKLTFLEWVLIIIFLQVVSFLMNPQKYSQVILVLIKDISVIFCLISLSFRHNPKIGMRYHVFYALYPINLYMILQEVYCYIIFAIFSMKLTSFTMASPSLGKIIGMIVAVIIPPFFYCLISKWLNIDISNVRKTLNNYLSARALRLVNATLLIFYPGAECFAAIAPFENMSTNRSVYRAIVFLYFILLFIFLFYLNFRHGQEQKNELLRNQEMELAALENYSKHVESFYQEVRSFRHDYANVLMSLKMGIDQGNLDDIKKIYEEITEDSTKLVKNNKFDLTRLANITDSGVKSLMSAKFLQAENQGIEISLEVAEKMGNPSIPLISYIRILSILFDNAIEGALESAEPKISVANFYQDGDFVFMIENSTKEKSVDLTKIFERGYSTKGDNRGLGLATLMDFQDDYENLSVETRSSDYTFTQVVRIYES
ncbi:two-component system, AgrA family, sensor histidine kinase AgrC [Streptococcus equinus]|uniref:Two-component system, AgrA family, sensor histidine kinase AgrC n=1 Tax=Streptococcus equinus TaxID=1335 RepID=A0A1H0ZLR4_STREI|nr:GHKL domain-containing protein [Streptococcus equinus]SDQ28287.1 two-component system, AgrA family, sensor histidine kinase AgrC [Streptococcus equinus]